MYWLSTSWRMWAAWIRDLIWFWSSLYSQYLDQCCLLLLSCWLFSALYFSRGWINYRNFQGHRTELGQAGNVKRPATIINSNVIPFSNGWSLLSAAFPRFEWKYPAWEKMSDVSSKCIIFITFHSFSSWIWIYIFLKNSSFPQQRL